MKPQDLLERLAAGYEYDPMYGEMCNERDQLKAENAKLREEISKYYDLYVHAITDAEVWHLQWSAEHQENAKLRELVSDLFKGFECGWPSDVCGDCERDGEGMPIHGCLLLNRASELGIEVSHADDDS